jgi:hypothetical protein
MGLSLSIGAPLGELGEGSLHQGLCKTHMCKRRLWKWSICLYGGSERGT